MTDTGPRSPAAPRTALLAEAALTGVSLATVAGYARLFTDAGYVAPVAAAAVLGHVLAAGLRRVGLGPVLATAVHLAGLALLLAWGRYLSTTANLVPTGATLDRIGDDLARSWDIFLDVSAPVPTAPGFVVVAMVAAWVVALAADGLAFRLHATAEAVAPATGLFLFSSILADDRHRVLAATLFVVSVLAFVLAARVARATAGGRWLATDTGRGARSLLATGLTLLAVAVPAAVLAGPRLPGGDGTALLDVDGAEGDDRITLSPLVDIRSRLVEQADVEAFRVEAAAPAYWRLTALDDFDGRIWSSSGRYVDAAGRLPTSPAVAAGASRLTQSFRIGALAQIWLPAAFEPLVVDSPDADVEFAADSSTLVVGADRETADGLRYDVVSILPRLDPDDLAVGTGGVDREFLDRFTRLPRSVGPVAARYARQAVGAADTDYTRALALQDWFRDRFTYRLDVAPGHGADALAAFLDPDGPRAGYCEQFAGAYAALARALGLPARVAVGFTPGEALATDPGTFVVRGRHAHAWPEVYFSGVGWVGFEPTPGRGAPGAESYTLVAPQQAEAGPAAPTSSVAPTVGTGTTPQRPTGADRLPALDTGAPTADRGGPDLTTGLAVLAALALGLWLVGVPLAGVVRTRRRRRAAVGRADALTRLAWDEAVAALALLRVTPRPAETAAEFARRAAGDTGTDLHAASGLADLAGRATWGRSVTAAEAAQARTLADQVIVHCRHLAGPWERLRAGVSPRRRLV